VQENKGIDDRQGTAMTIVELVKGFAHELATGVVVTDAGLNEPGPTILYVNPAFEQLVGYNSSCLLGQSPRILQGNATSPFTIRALSAALRAGQSFHTCLTNYRADGASYLCEIDIRPIVNGRGKVEHFIAFEREVVRRRVKARPGLNIRYKARNPQTEAEAAGILAPSGCFASRLD
jgi:PAS domain S-box-containing protein